MEAAAGKQPLGIFFNVVGDELIYAVCESDYVWRHIVDECRTVDSAGVEIAEERFRRAAVFGDLLKVRPLLLHQLERLWLKHLQRRDMNVAVGNHVGLSFRFS